MSGLETSHPTLGSDWLDRLDSIPYPLEGSGAMVAISWADVQKVVGETKRLRAVEAVLRKELERGETVLSHKVEAMRRLSHELEVRGIQLRKCEARVQQLEAWRELPPQMRAS